MHTAENSRTRKLHAILEDARYQRALEICDQRGDPTVESSGPSGPEQAFEAAVAYLAGQGIPEPEARKNLVALIT